MIIVSLTMFVYFLLGINWYKKVLTGMVIANK
nr:MAG TPA_asm: hypothetical protein [Caudoviricetes sp.]